VKELSFGRTVREPCLKRIVSGKEWHRSSSFSEPYRATCVAEGPVWLCSVVHHTTACREGFLNGVARSRKRGQLPMPLQPTLPSQPWRWPAPCRIVGYSPEQTGVDRSGRTFGFRWHLAVTTARPTSCNCWTCANQQPVSQDERVDAAAGDGRGAAAGAGGGPAQPQRPDAPRLGAWY